MPDRSLESLATVAIPPWIIVVVMALVLSKFVELSTSEVRLHIVPLSSHSPAMPQSGRARAKTLVLDGSLESLTPADITSCHIFETMALVLSHVLLLTMLCHGKQCPTLARLTRFPFLDSPGFF